MSLPSGYKRLEYIQSSGTQYIDTGFKPNQNTKVVCRVSGYSKNSNPSTNLFGCRTSTSSSDMFSFNIAGSTGYRTDFYNSRVSFDSSLSYDAIIIVTKDKNICKIESEGVSTTVTNTSGDFQSTYSMFVIGENRGGSVHTPPSVKLYSCQIYDNDVLVRDYIPCQKPDGTNGLWDDVNSVFYGNAGTGTFTAGPVVAIAADKSEITKLEYIQSTGTQYINTGFDYGSLNFTNLRIVADSIIGTAPNGWAVSGVGDTTCFYYGCGNNSRVIYYGNGNSDVSTGVTFTEKRSIFDLSHKSKTFKVTEVESSNVLLNLNITLGTPSHSAKPIYLFAYHDSSRNVAYCHGETLYGCKIYDNGTLIRDYIPAKLSNGTVGLYDKLNGLLYINAGTGTFEAGPSSLNLPVNIGGTWKDANEAFVNIGGIWKTVEAAFVNIDGTWKELG